jgi:hypothetical protein
VYILSHCVALADTRGSEANGRNSEPTMSWYSNDFVNLQERIFVEVDKALKLHVKWPVIPLSRYRPSFHKPRWTSAFPRPLNSQDVLPAFKVQQKGMKRVALLTTLLPRRHFQNRARSITLLTFQQRYPLTNRHSFTSTAMADHPTLVKPPPIDPLKSSIENVLELTELSAIAPVGNHFYPRPICPLPMPMN